LKGGGGGEEIGVTESIRIGVLVDHGVRPRDTGLREEATRKGKKRDLKELEGVHQQYLRKRKGGESHIS